jgi:hypothetical protein
MKYLIFRMETVKLANLIYDLWNDKIDNIKSIN